MIQPEGSTYDENNNMSYYNMSVFQNGSDLIGCQFYDVKQIEGYQYAWTRTDVSGRVRYTYQNEAGGELMLSEEEAVILKDITLGERIKGEKPYFVTGDLTLLFPESALKTLDFNEDMFVNLEYYANSKNHKESYNELREKLLDSGFNAERRRTTRLLPT